MAVKLNRTEANALRTLADQDAADPGAFWLMPLTPRKTRVKLVEQGYIEAAAAGPVVTYRITDDGRRAAKIRTPEAAR